MHRMSTRCQPTPRWGWLLLLGGLTACGYDTPWASRQAAASPAGSGTSEPENAEDADTIDPNADVGAMGVFDERFVKKGYGAAWSVRAADLDGDGTDELIYGGNAVVAMGRGEEPRWTFELPAVEGKYDRQPAEAEEPDEADAADATGKEGKSAKDEAAQKLRFMGVHVREMRAAAGNLFVLDSADRIHVLDSTSGELVYTVELESDGIACDFALLDADGDEVADFFPSGGVAAYSGKTGERVWEADVGFTPMSVESGNLDANPGRDLLLIGGSKKEKAGYGICPAEKTAVMAMHDGMKDEEKALPRDEYDDPAAARPGAEGGEGRRGEMSVAALDTGGQTLYEANLGAGRIYAATLYDLDGDEQDNVILGTSDGLVTLDAKGAIDQEIAIDGRINHLFATDLDKDGQSELLVGAYANDRTTLYAYGRDGNALWNAPLDGRAYTIEAYDLDGDGSKELITGLGYGDDPTGEAPTIAWSIGPDGPTELWRFGTVVPAQGYVVLPGMDGDMAGNDLYIAGGDAIVHTLSADSGKEIDTWSAGGMNHAVAAGDLDGDGSAETITGDVYGNVSVIGADGEKIFDGMLEGEGPAVVTGIDVAKNEAGSPSSFVVSGYAWRGENAGVLQAFDAEGNTLFAVTTPNGLAEAKFADLDGDGTQEIVVSHFTFRFGEERRQPESPTVPVRGTEEDREGRGEGYDAPKEGESCGVMAYDLSGKLLWNADIASCDISQIAIGDIDGNGTDEVAYGDLGRNGPYHVALLDGEGTPLWNIESELNDTVWIEIVEGGVAFGGRSGEDGGHVTLLEAKDGMERWNMDAGGKAENAPVMEKSPFGSFSGSLFGQKLDDVNGDGTMDLAYTTVDGDVRLVDGNNGEPIWEGSLADARYEEPQNGREERDGVEQVRGTNDLVGGPLTYVPGTDGGRGLLVVTGYDFERFGSEAFAFDLDTGNLAGSIAFDDLVVGVAPAAWSGGGEGVVVTTAYDTHGLSIGEDRRGDDRPLPEREGYDEPNVD